MAYDWSRPALTPILPGRKLIGPLKDMATEVVTASAGLEKSIAKVTARNLGERLRLINSYYSNLIEGHKTTIPEIEAALVNRFVEKPERRYAQELCAAHVLTEREFMTELERDPHMDICSADVLSRLHASFYSHLPADHLSTHHAGGFSGIPVMPETCGTARCLLTARRSMGRTPRSYHDTWPFSMTPSHHRPFTEMKNLSPPQSVITA